MLRRGRTPCHIGEPMPRPRAADELASLTVPDLRARFAGREPTRAEWEALKADPRGGVRELVERIQGGRKEEARESRRLTERLRFERELWAQGLERVAGCDEAGVSPLAGPVVAGAVIFRPEERIRWVDDSKVLDAKTREALAEEIRARAVAWAVGVVSPQEIDALNIYRAGLLAMRRALEGLSPAPQHVLLDARRVPEFPVPQTKIIRGDALSLAIGAASILAKTHRDRLMCELDLAHPGYGFAAHKGYPVAAHFEALRRLGPCEIHRRSFAPVREALEGRRQGELFG
jgi:ribonuclease HII